MREHMRVARFEVSPNREINISPKYKMLCDYILGGMENREAYLKVYPNSGEMTAKNEVQRILGREEVKAYLKKMGKIAEDVFREKFSVDSDKVMRELSYMILFDPMTMYDDNGEIKPIRKMDISTRRALSIEAIITEDGKKAVKIKTPSQSNKNESLALTAKIMGMIIDKSAHLDRQEIIHEIRGMDVDKAQALLDELKKKRLELISPAN